MTPQQALHQSHLPIRNALRTPNLMKAVGVEIAQLIVEIDEIQQIVAEHRRRRERHQDLPSDGS